MGWENLQAEIADEFRSVALAWEELPRAGYDDDERGYFVVSRLAPLGVRALGLGPEPTAEATVDDLTVNEDLEAYRRRLRIAADALSGRRPRSRPRRARISRESRLVALLKERGPLNRRQAFKELSYTWRDFLATWQVVSEKHPELVDSRLPSNVRIGRRPKTLALKAEIVALLEREGPLSRCAVCRLTGGSFGTVCRLFRDLETSHPRLFVPRPEKAKPPPTPEQVKHATAERARMADPVKRAAYNARRKKARAERKRLTATRGGDSSRHRVSENAASASGLVDTDRRTVAHPRGAVVIGHRDT